MASDSSCEGGNSALKSLPIFVRESVSARPDPSICSVLVAARQAPTSLSSHTR